MPEPLLTILKFCLLALIYLFFLRVLRAVWAEIGGAGATAGLPPPPRGRAEGGGPSRIPRWGVGGRLRVVEPTEMRGQTYEVADELTMGRAAGCQITLDDNYVSQLHARLFRRDGQLYVEDLGSTNGTYLNRKKVTTPIALRKGDRLQLGKTVMELTK